MTSFAKRMGGSNSARVSKISGASGHASDCSSYRKGYALGGSVLNGPDEFAIEGDETLGGPLDRPLSGPKKNPTTIVNVTVAGKGADQATPSPGLVPPSARAPAPPPPPMAPPPGVVGGGAPPPGTLPPLPLGPMKNGGRVGYKAGGKVGTQSGPTQVSSTKPIASADASKLDPSHPPVHIKNRAAGGKVEMDAGAGSGIGRLEKIGKKP